MSPVPFYKQEKEWTCGAACLRMIFEKLGITKTEKQMTRLLKTGKKRGTWHKDFPRVAEKYQFNYSVRRNASINDLREFLNKKYFIIICYHFPKDEFDHYAIVKNVDSERIYLIDPTDGPKHKYKLSYFEKIWKSYAKYDNDKRWFFAVKE